MGRWAEDEHPKRPVVGFECTRSEVSGARLWGWARDRFGEADRFFDQFFAVNYCPLVFMEDTGRNRTPDKLPQDERAPLYAACAHGCGAGRYQEAYDEVYRRRIRRENEHFNTRKLGAFGAELSVVAGFFETPFTTPAAVLGAGNQAFLLNQAGLCLRALGRLGINR